MIIYANRLMISMNEYGDFPISPTTGAYIMGFMQLFGASSSYLAITYIGRKKIMMFGQFMEALIWLICGIGLVNKWLMTVFVCLCLFIFVF